MQELKRMNKQGGYIWKIKSSKKKEIKKITLHLYVNMSSLHALFQND